MIKKKQYYIVF